MVRTIASVIIRSAFSIAELANGNRARLAIAEANKVRFSFISYSEQELVKCVDNSVFHSWRKRLFYRLLKVLMIVHVYEAMFHKVKICINLRLFEGFPKHICRLPLASDILGVYTFLA